MARQELSTRFPTPNARYTAKTIHGKLAVQPDSFDFTYTTPAPFCTADKLTKGKCTVQLNFIDGKPVLRLCNAKNKPGRTIPLTDATAARRIAKAACSSFDANKAFPELFTNTTDEDIEYDAASELRGLGLAKRSKRGRSSAAHARSEMLWAAVARARTPAERARATEAAEAHDARLSGTGAGKPRMMTLSLAGIRKPTKARGTKLKWCVYTKTKSGARKLSCHKLKRTAQAAAKKRKGATVRNPQGT